MSKLRENIDYILIYFPNSSNICVQIPEIPIKQTSPDTPIIYPYTVPKNSEHLPGRVIHWCPLFLLSPMPEPGYYLFAPSYNREELPKIKEEIEERVIFVDQETIVETKEMPQLSDGAIYTIVSKKDSEHNG